MTEQEKAQKELLDAIKVQVTEQLKGLTDGTIKAEEVNKKFDEISKNVNENFTSKTELENVKKELDKVVTELEAQRQIAGKQARQLDEIEKGKRTISKEMPIFFVDAIKDAMEGAKLIERKQIIAGSETKEVERLNIDLADNARKSWTFDLPENVIFAKKERNANKAVIDQSIAATMGSSAADILRYISPRLSELPLSNNVHVIQVLDTETTKSMYYSVLIQYTKENGTDTVDEQTANGQSSFLIKLVDYKMFTVGTFYKTTEEMLEDFPRFLAEMNRIAPDDIMDELDIKVLGTATNPSTGIVGLRNSTYSATIDFAGADAGLIPSDLGTVNTIVDVIAIAKTKATKRTATTGGYKPDVVFMNETDIVGLEAEKNADADSVSDRRMVFIGGMLVAIAGLRVIKNDNIPAGQLLIADSARVTVVTRRQITMAMNYDSDGDFTSRQPTFRFDMRAANAPRTEATGATIWVSDLAQAIADLNAAS